jgi:hypothetical protein
LEDDAGVVATEEDAGVVDTVEDVVDSVVGGTKPAETQMVVVVSIVVVVYS